MAIRVVCPSCDAAFSVSDEMKGKKIRCRECEKPIAVGAAKPKKAVEADEDVEERVQTKPRKPAPSRPRDDDPKPRRRPARYVEDDDEDEEESRPRRKEKKSSPLPLILAMVGGGVVILGGILGLVIWLAVRDTDKKPDNTVASTPPAGKGGPPAGMMGGGQGGMMGGGMMGGKGGGMPKGAVIIPDEHAGGGAIVIDPWREKDIPLDKEVLSKIKKATALILIKEKGRTVSSGSGFLAYEPGIVLTNAHVVDMLEPGSEKPEEIEVVFNSTEADEKRVKAEVLGADRAVDLAVLRVPPDGLPPHLEVKSALSLTETQIVYFCGFPKPQMLGETIKINGAQVTGIDKDPRTHLPKQLTLKGDMLPGNSGGPVVDEKGNVCGVSVSILVGTRVNFAVPGDFVDMIVNGRLARTRVGQCFRSVNHINVPLKFDLINPLERINSVEVEVWSGDSDPKYIPPPSTATPPPRRPSDSEHKRYPLRIQGERATGDITLPDLPSGKTYWWQPVVTYKDKKAEGGLVTHWSSGEKYEPDEPVEKRQVRLLYKNHPGNRNVSLKIAQSFTVFDQSGRQRQLQTDLVGDLVEREGPLGADKKSPLGVGVNQFTIIPRKDTPPLSKERERALEHTSFLDLQMQLNERGDVENQVISAKGSPPDVRRQVERYGDLINSALHAVSVPMPNRNISHAETWDGKRPLSILTTNDIEDLKMDMTYTYLGRRVREGRDEALIDISGKLPKKGSKVGIGGLIEGRALIDVESGVITLARATVSFDLEMHYEGVKLRSCASLEVRMNRDLPK